MTFLKLKKLPKSLLVVALTTGTLGLTACGGSDAEETIDRIEAEYDRIADDVKDEYQRVEDKLNDDEKSMAEILESVFLPEESLDEFLDKLTPEGGKGGLYVGHFVELGDGDDDDVDIGAMYFDIPKDGAGSVDGRISYQQQPCQDNNTLATDSAVKVDNYLTGKLSGSLDTPEFLDIKYVNDLDIATPNILTTFDGSFKEDLTGEPWSGRFEYQDGLGGTELSSGKDNCNVSYTLGKQANYVTYPLDYQRGELMAKVIGIGSTARLVWTNPAGTAMALVSQINVNEAGEGANGFVVNQLFKDNDPAGEFSPQVTDTPTNYAFVVQAFDADNRLLGYDAVVMDLPEAP